MKTLFFCPFWGMENLSYTDAAKRVKTAGYDGMEIAAGPDKRNEAVQVMHDNGLELILMAFGAEVTLPNTRKNTTTICSTSHPTSRCSLTPIPVTTISRSSKMLS
ncbi:hypothetical protein [Spirosoma telluris]|uniref:hypothetical protein n=1 Tax=Spirosoma telluris TaxID=2183553 RepID=UPI002FC3B795